ncbi:MAG: FAD:protein FMN transferase [Chloroflexota bacterium]
MIAAAPAAAFRAMSVEVGITGSGVSGAEVARAAVEAETLAEWWEDLFSRFRPGSALCRLNAADGAPMAAEPAFLDVLAMAREAVFASGGRFDPSVLPALEAAGYDRDFPLLGRHAAGGQRTPRPAAGRSAWRMVDIDRAAGTVTLPAGMRIDLGGIAKGAFADLLASRLGHWPGGLVDAGGDLRAWGRADDGGPWRVAIADPLRAGRDLAVADLAGPVRAGGVATSGVLKRRWGAGAHHLIDPGSGLPADGALVAVTAFAPTCAAAEVAAKAVLIGAASGNRAAMCGAARVFGVTRAGDLIEFEECGEHRDAVTLDDEMDPFGPGDHRA